MKTTVEKVIRRNAPSTMENISVFYVDNDIACIKYDVGDAKEMKMVIDLEMSEEELHDFMITESCQALARHIRIHG